MISARLKITETNTKEIIDSKQTKSKESLSAPSRSQRREAEHTIKKRGKETNRWCEHQCLDPPFTTRLWHMRGRRLESSESTSKNINFRDGLGPAPGGKKNSKIRILQTWFHVEIYIKIKNYNRSGGVSNFMQYIILQWTVRA